MMEMEEASRGWIVRSAVVRLLVHYDFLYVGVGEVKA